MCFIKINLKKNVLSVNFHVGQYAKIVEDLKGELTQLKQKLVSLQLENEALSRDLTPWEQEALAAYKHQAIFFDFTARAGVRSKAQYNLAKIYPQESLVNSEG